MFFKLLDGGCLLDFTTCDEGLKYEEEPYNDCLYNDNGICSDGTPCQGCFLYTMVIKEIIVYIVKVERSKL